MAEGVIGSLILKLRDALGNESGQLGSSLLVYEASALKGLFGEIRMIKEELESMQAFFCTAERFKDTDETTVAFVKQIRGLAFDIEDVIDEFTYKLGEDREGMFLLKAIRRIRQIKTWYRLANSLQDIKVNLKSAAERRCRYDLKGVRRDKKLMRLGSLNQRSTESVHFKREADLVGIAENKQLLKDWLKDEEQRHMIITVWGMGGVGKTTLVAHVYSAIKTDFDTCAWITVSNSYEADDLLKQIVVEFRKNDHKKEFPKDVDVTDYRSLTLLLMEASSEMVFYLGALVNLRSFRISKVQGCHCAKLFFAITNMVHLIRLGIHANDKQEVLQLEALKPPPLLQKLILQGTLDKESLPRFFMSISKLKSLTILRLVWSKLDEEDFYYIEELQQLVKLQLYDAYNGKRLSFQATSFPKLRILKIWGAPHLSLIKIERGAMSSLVDLKLLLCPELKLLPRGIEHVTTLEEMTLDSTAEEIVGRVRKKNEAKISHVKRVYVGFIRNGELAAERIQ
ncbi:hypothetical protein E2562_026723 [Oryza meyeriana var. granulata]|uniref:Rx N-terminal domain-containing protein n=1 Tax=Oryza meyeriana var. granulata TaxID=110450 RepID=A0A6G1EZ49_9ORYZ|nr:hypothetical protein E2562_026723 [Oryza meyeriana var. granulata]